MSSPFTIRRAVVEDLPVLFEFEQGLISAERPFDNTLVPEKFHYYDLEQMILGDDTEVLVAEADGRLVGSGHCRIIEGKHYNQYKDYAFLGFMYVMPEYRGKGINQAIIGELVEWSRARGLTEVRLQVYDENIPAIKAYEKVGFRKILTEMRLEVIR